MLLCHTFSDFGQSTITMFEYLYESGYRKTSCCCFCFLWMKPEQCFMILHHGYIMQMKPSEFLQGPLYFEAISCSESLDKSILQDVAVNKNCDLTLKDEVDDSTIYLI